MKKIIYFALLFSLISVDLFAQDSVCIHLKSKALAKYAIADIDSIKFEKTVHYNYYISNSTKPAFSHFQTSIPPITAASDFEIVYNAATKTNLNNLVWATANNGSIEKKLNDFGLGNVGVNYKFVFSDAFSYLGPDGLTDHNSFIQIETNGDITVLMGTAAIDRSPLVKVQLQTLSGQLLAQAYIKFIITGTPIVNNTPYTKEIPKPDDIQYQSLFKDAVAGVSAGDVTALSITWLQMNEIYAALGISHNIFQTVYTAISPTVAVKINGVSIIGDTYSQYPLIRSLQEPDYGTSAFKYNITPLLKFGTTELIYTLNPQDTKYPILNLKFTVTILRPVLDKNILPQFQYLNSTSVYTQGTNIQNSWNVVLSLGEAFGFGSSTLSAKFGVGANKIDPATHEFIVTDNYKTTGIPSYIFSQALPSQTSLSSLLGTSYSTGVKMGMNPVNPLEISQRSYPVNFKTTYPNGETDNFNYNIIFANPLTIETETTADFTLLDIKSGAKDMIDLSKNYVVKIQGDVLFNKNGIVSAKAAEYGITNPIQTYNFLNITPTYSYATSFVTPVISWQNVGSRLTSIQKIGDAKFTFKTAFSSVTRTDAVTVTPDTLY